MKFALLRKHFYRDRFNHFPVETSRQLMNRKQRATPIFTLIGAASPVDWRGLLPIGAFPLLESLFPADSGDKEKARVIISLLKLGLREDSDL